MIFVMIVSLKIYKSLPFVANISMRFWVNLDESMDKDCHAIFFLRHIKVWCKQKLFFVTIKMPSIEGEKTMAIAINDYYEW